MLRDEIQQFFVENPGAIFRGRAPPDFPEFKRALNAGEVRAAEPDATAKSGWRVNAWVKKGILFGFRMGDNRRYVHRPARQPFFDKSTYPVKRL